jgi:hypothetical protein
MHFNLPWRVGRIAIMRTSGSSFTAELQLRRTMQNHYRDTPIETA